MTKPKPRVKAGTSKAAANERKRLFAEAFCANGGNATQAAKTAGYSPRSAYSTGATLLKDPVVVPILAKRRAALLEKAGLKAERVLQELSTVAHSDVTRLFDSAGNVLPISEWPEDLRGAVASIEIGPNETRIKLWDKNGALNMALKHLGQFEKDNAQKVDPIADMMAAIAARGLTLPVKP